MSTPPAVIPTIDRLPVPLRRFLDQLTAEQKLLLVLKRELYDGDWTPMIADLNNRLDGKPYVFRLADRIDSDLQRIQHMRQIETHYEVDLANFIQALPHEESGE